MRGTPVGESDFQTTVSTVTPPDLNQRIQRLLRDIFREQPWYGERIHIRVDDNVTYPVAQALEL